MASSVGKVCYALFRTKFGKELENWIQTITMIEPEETFQMYHKFWPPFNNYGKTFGVKFIDPVKYGINLHPRPLQKVGLMKKTKLPKANFPQLLWNHSFSTVTPGYSW